MKPLGKGIVERKRARKKQRVKVSGCPRTKNHTNWCYALCVPKDGIGECGRPAHHAHLGRTQIAIMTDLARRGKTRY